MAQLYANENFPYQVVEALRKLGHDVLTVQEAGKGGQEIRDDEVLAFATEQNRAVVTINRRDFIRLHSSDPTQDIDTEGQAKRIDQAIQTVKDLAGQLLRVNRPQK
jgi:predicted nuclease of predicted toxin-antitoxin system